MSLRDLENATSVFVTHDLKSARTMANEVAVKDAGDDTILFKERNGSQPSNTHFVILEGGRILLQGTADDLQDTHDPYIREFLD